MNLFFGVSEDGWVLDMADLSRAVDSVDQHYPSPGRPQRKTAKRLPPNADECSRIARSAQGA